MKITDAGDVIDALHGCGAHFIVVGKNIRFRAKEPIPVEVTAGIRDHKTEVIKLMLAVPAGCPVPHVCRRIGVCPREIDHSACTIAAAHESEAA